MDYLIRLAQVHEDFRLAEVRSLASLFSINIEIIFYSTNSPFLLLRIISYPASQFPSPSSAARALISRSVLSLGIYELWGMTPEDNDDDGAKYTALHVDVQTRTDLEMWSRYKEASFKFSLDAYCGKRSPSEQTEIINSFSYLGFEGPIRMRNPDLEFTIFEEWSLKGSPHHEQRSDETPPSSSLSLETPAMPYQAPILDPFISPRSPKRLYFGLLVASSPRQALILKHDLKRRPYISTTSMDATLALVSANLAHASQGCIIYDPFVGTGGFLVAAAEFGACVSGSDIDGRSFRGTGKGPGKGGSEQRYRRRGVWRNFDEYGLGDLLGDCFIGDLTNTPLRRDNDSGGWLDGIICDPPYGVREGLKVLGSKEPRPDGAPHMIDGVPAHTLPGYVAPKKPYSFERMLDDILVLAADTLVVDGRLAFWMPSANEDDELLAIPSHKDLKLMECCAQRFYRWSRRLLVYRRTTRVDRVDANGGLENGQHIERVVNGKTASDLNPFRKKYFQGFQT